jgi:hypothetical protein
MRDEHVKDILDRGDVSALATTDFERVRAHAEGCPECLRALRAALVSASLLSARAAEEFAPPPFFETRVLAAFRERQQRGGAWALRRLWNAAGSLVASMALAVAALAAFTALGPDSSPAETASAAYVYPAEGQQTLAQGGDEELTDEQIFSAIYEAEDSAQ